VVDTDVSINTVKLTNAQAGDVLAVGALPAGISANINASVAGEITVTLSGNASLADYETAVQAITFENTSEAPIARSKYLSQTPRSAQRATSASPQSTLRQSTTHLPSTLTSRQPAHPVRAALRRLRSPTQP